MERQKRSLSQTGGKCRMGGETAFAEKLAHAMRVGPVDKLPYTHGFHPYPARMHPETALRILEAFPGGAVLDPFVGSGTVAVESLRSGRPFTGVDVSGVALEVAWARTRNWHPDKCRAFEQAGLSVVEKAYGENERDEFWFPDWAMPEKRWYDPHTLREICVLKALIDAQEPEVKRLLAVVLSSIVVKISKQRTDSDTRPDKFHRPVPRHQAFRAFREKLPSLTRGLLQLSSDLYKRKVAVVEPVLLMADARGLTAGEPKPRLILTSPPYAGTYDYVRHHERRYPLFDQNSQFALDAEIGARRNTGAGYRQDLAQVLVRMKEALAPDGEIVLLIGDGAAGAADKMVSALGPKAGLRIAASASQKRRDWSGGPSREEHLLLLRRA